MIFHEIYSSYYRVLADILREAQAAPISTAKIHEIIRRHAFSESSQTIPQKLSSGDWPLLENQRSRLAHIPRRPTSLLEIRWLASILRDPRVQLFLPATESPPDISLPPLWKEEDIFYFDRHRGGDPFADLEYIRNFRALLSALREKKQIAVRYVSKKGKPISYHGTVSRVEYSQKDDKFRFLLLAKDRLLTLNAAQIQSTVLLKEPAENQAPPAIKKQVVVKILDERQTLNRTMLHFSDLEKITCAEGERTYRMTLSYYPDDEAEILIRLLSFGPFVKVISPAEMVEKVRDRLGKQKEKWK